MEQHCRTSPEYSKALIGRPWRTGRTCKPLNSIIGALLRPVYLFIIYNAYFICRWTCANLPLHDQGTCRIASTTGDSSLPPQVAANLPQAAAKYDFYVMIGSHRRAAGNVCKPDVQSPRDTTMRSQRVDILHQDVTFFTIAICYKYFILRARASRPTARSEG